MDKFCNFIIRILLEWIRADCSHWVYCNMYWALSTLSFSLDGEFIQLHWTLLCYLCGCGCNARFDSANGSMLSMGLTASAVVIDPSIKIFSTLAFLKSFFIFKIIFFLNFNGFFDSVRILPSCPFGMASRIWTYRNNNKVNDLKLFLLPSTYVRLFSLPNTSFKTGFFLVLNTNCSLTDLSFTSTWNLCYPRLGESY